MKPPFPLRGVVVGVRTVLKLNAAAPVDQVDPADFRARMSDIRRRAWADPRARARMLASRGGRRS